MGLYRRGVKKKDPKVMSKVEKINEVLFGIQNPRPEITSTPSDYGLEFQIHNIQLVDKVNIHGWYIPNEQASEIVILLHSFRRSKSDLLDEASAFHHKNFAVFMFDFRGSGGSSESYATFGVDETKDLYGVIKYVKKELGYEKYILFGQSMGGTTILRTVAKTDITPLKIIVESIFYSLLETTKSRLKIKHFPSFPLGLLIIFWWSVIARRNGFGINNANYSKNIECPILMMHGELDVKARIGTAIIMFNQLEISDKEFVSMPGLGHEAFILKHNGLWMEKVLKFL